MALSRRSETQPRKSGGTEQACAVWGVPSTTQGTKLGPLSWTEDWRQEEAERRVVQRDDLGHSY